MSDDRLVDLTRTCVECGFDFVWTAGEQVFYNDKSFKPPRRCAKCRPLQRARAEVGRALHEGRDSPES